jgi:3-methyl-2-oxobutanoate hydroxymethyltransferase
MSRKGAAFPVLTAYDAAFGRLVESAGIDCILIGDSMGMVVLGFSSTANVELADVERCTAAVARGTQSAHLVADLPFGSYESDDRDAIRSSIRLVKAGASSVKLEGGVRSASRIEAIVRAGIPVMGHIGVAPQTAGLREGFQVMRDRGRLIAEASAVEQAGAYAIVLELVDPEIAGEITRTLTIPTIGIGSGPHCDGQVLVLHDVLGLYPEAPSFAKRYANLSATTLEAVRAFADDVKKREFPV